MASSRVENQILWATAASITLSSASRQDSDAIALNIEDWDGLIQVSADNSGTPATGDIVKVYLKYSSGDILGDSGDDFDTDEHAIPLGMLDTYSSNTPGEDPARASFPLPSLASGKLKLSIEAPQAGTRNIVVRARLVTHRGQ